MQSKKIKINNINILNIKHKSINYFYFINEIINYKDLFIYLLEFCDIDDLCNFENINKIHLILELRKLGIINTDILSVFEDIPREKFIDKEFILNKEKVVTTASPKPDILNSYKVNVGRGVVLPSKKLITE
mgnify:CR=1 FL=1